MEVLSLCLPYVERYFQRQKLRVVFFMARITQILSFLGMQLLERWKITVWEYLFKKIICYESFEFVSPLTQKVLSGAPVKCVFLCGSNNSDSAIVGNAAFWEIKDDSLRRKHLFKKIAMELLSLCLPSVKIYFQEHQLSVFFMAQITGFVIFGNAAFGKIKNYSWRTSPYQKKYLL